MLTFLSQRVSFLSTFIFRALKELILQRKTAICEQLYKHNCSSVSIEKFYGKYSDLDS